MYQIVGREDLTPEIHLFEIDAPQVARKAQAGQFVVIRVDEKGERIPLTIANWDRKKGTVTVVFMEIGKTTQALATLKAGESIANFAGPLGVPTEIEKFGTVVCVAGGFATAIVVPVARELKKAGNKIISVMGFRNKDMVFWEDRLSAVSDEIIVTTDDGSYGRSGVVTTPLTEVLERKEKTDRVIAIGPTVMMKFCSAATLPFGVRSMTYHSRYVVASSAGSVNQRGSGLVYPAKSNCGSRVSMTRGSSASTSICHSCRSNLFRISS